MAGEWRQITLGDVMSLANGKTSPERSDGMRHPVYGSNGVIGLANETNSPENTIVIGRVGSYCGSLYLSKQKCWVTDNAIRASALDDNDGRFLFYLLSSLDLNHWRSGSGQPLLNQTILSQIPASAPPADEQRAIAQILCTLDDKIELNRRMNETIEAMSRAIFKSWFVDFDPIHGLGPHKEWQDSPLGTIPKGWEVKTVADIVELYKNVINPGDFPYEMFEHYSIPAYDEGQMPTHDLGLIIKSNKFLLPENCILISKLNPRIPRVWFPKINTICRSIASTEFLVLVPKRPYTCEFIYSLCISSSFQDTFVSLVTGTSSSHQRVKPEDLLVIKIMSPSDVALKMFSERVEPLFKQFQSNKEQYRTLATIRDALLPQLLSGEIRVKFVERVI